MYTGKLFSKFLLVSFENFVCFCVLQLFNLGALQVFNLHFSTAEQGGQEVPATPKKREKIKKRTSILASF